MLRYIANKLFGQQWLFEKIEDSNIADIEKNQDSEELSPEVKRRQIEIGHLDFVSPTRKAIEKWLLNFHLFAIKI